MSRLRWAIFSAFAVLLMSGHSPALALDRGECAGPEDMTAKLKAEGQRSIAVGDRIIRKNNLNTLNGMIFTMSADRSTGYILQSDADSSTRASKICVHARLADLRLFDARTPGPPEASLLKASEADAKRRCADLIKGGSVEAGTCGTLNADLHAAEREGERVMFQGFNVSKQRDGTFTKDGTLSTVTATLTDEFRNKPGKAPMPRYGAIYFSALPEGATIVNVMLAYDEYTPYGLSLLGTH